YKAGSRLFQFDKTGKFVREIGVGMYGFNFAQQVRIDPQDNIWVVDQGSSNVIKFDPEGRHLLTLSRKPEAISVRPFAGAAGAGRGGAAPEGRGGAPASTPAAAPGAGAATPGAGAAGGGGGRRRSPGTARTPRIGHPRRQLQSDRRRRVGQGGQHLRRRRREQIGRQRADREIRQGRPFHQELGLARQRARPVQRDSRDRD